MPCYAVPCYATLCSTTLYFAILSYATPYSPGSILEHSIIADSKRAQDGTLIDASIARDAGHGSGRDHRVDSSRVSQRGNAMDRDAPDAAAGHYWTTGSA